MLKLKITEARGLLGKDKDGTSDPFVKISCGDQKFKTQVVRSTCDPIWDETFDIVTSGEKIELDVFDKNKVGKDFLGKIDFVVAEIVQKGGVDGWFVLEKRSKRSHVAGDIRVEFVVVDGDVDKVEKKKRKGVLGLSKSRARRSDDSADESDDLKNSAGKSDEKRRSKRQSRKIDKAEISDDLKQSKNKRRSKKIGSGDIESSDDLKRSKNKRHSKKIDSVEIESSDDLKHSKGKRHSNKSGEDNTSDDKKKSRRHSQKSKRKSEKRKSAVVTIIPEELEEDKSDPNTEQVNSELDADSENISHEPEMSSKNSSESGNGDVDVESVVEFNPSPGDIFELRIIEASDLMAADSNGLSDPYCDIKFASKEYKTEIIWENLNPVWDQAFNLKIQSLELDEINIVVNDKDSRGHDFLGRITIPLSDILNAPNGELDSWYDLQKKKGGKKVKGKIHIASSFNVDDDAEEALGKKKKKLGISLGGSKKTKQLQNSKKDSSKTPISKTNPEGDTIDFELSEGDLFELKIIEASDLMAADSNGLSDPYCDISFSSKDFKTKVIDETLNPVWNETFILKIKSLETDYLRIVVNDKDTLGHDFLGKVELPLSDLSESNGELDRWYDLKKKKGGKNGQGKIHIAISFNIDESVREKYEKDKEKKKLSLSLKSSKKPKTSPRLETITVSESAGPTPSTHLMVIELCEARELSERSNDNSTDPYGIIKCDDQKQRSSIKKGMEPVWNQSFKFNWKLNSDIKIQIYDDGQGMKDTFLGQTFISIDQILAKPNFSEWFNLEKKAGGKDVSGSVLIEVSFEARGDQDILLESSNDEYSLQNVDPLDLQGDLIQFEIVEARNLLAKDKNGLSDPFCKIQLDKQKYRTKVIPESLNPVWSKVFYLTYHEDDVIKLKFLDYDGPKKKCDFLGVASLRVADILEKKEFDDWIPLAKRTAKSHVQGDVHIRYSLIPETFQTEDQIKKLLRIQRRDVLLVDLDVIEAVDLLAKDKDGASDPFCVIKIDDLKFKTPVIDHTLNPVWQYHTRFPYASMMESVINIAVYDKDKTGREFLGKIDIPIKRLFKSEAGEVGKWFVLEKKSDGGRVSGSIHLRLALIQKPRVIARESESSTDEYNPRPKKKPVVEDKITVVKQPVQEPEPEVDDSFLFSEKSVLKKNNSLIDTTFKLIVIGESGVGKTQVLNNWLSGKMATNTKSTIGPELYSKTYNVQNRIIKINCWDTAGQEKFHSMTAQYYRGALGAIVVFDVTDESSFLAVEKWIGDFKSESDDEPVILLIGNKVDLKSQRVIDTKTAVQFATENGVNYLETSASSGHNIRLALATILQDVYENSHLSTVPGSIDNTNTTNQFHPSTNTINLNQDPIPEEKKDCICG